MTVLLVLAALWLVGQLITVVMVTVCAMILAGTLAPFVEKLEGKKVRRPFAIAIVFGVLTLFLTLWGLATIPSLIDQVSEIVTTAPQTQARLASALASHRVLAPWADSVRHFNASQLMTHAAPGAFAASLGVVEAIGYTGTAVVLAIYFLADRERVRGFVYALFPRRYHVRLARVLMNMETIVGGYVRGQVITSVAMFFFALGLLLACGVKHALAIAAFAGIADVIPFIGALLALTPAVLAALPRGEVIVIVIVVVMTAYQEVESRILVPRVYGRTLRLPSAAVILALLVGGELGGILGALLALPMAAAIRMLVEELRVELPGDDSDHPETRAKDLAAERVYAKQSVGASPEEAAKLAASIVGAVEDGTPLPLPPTPPRIKHH